MKLSPWILVGATLACQGEPSEEPGAGGGLPGYTGPAQNVQPGMVTAPAAAGNEAAGDHAAGDQTLGGMAAGASSEGGAMASELGTEQAGTGQLETQGVSGSSDSEVAGGDTEPEPVTEQPPVVSTEAAAELNRVLVFTRTEDYRHDSIGAGVAALTSLGEQNGFSVQQTEQPGDFNDANLAQFDVVVFLSTTADVLQADQEAAFERYIQANGGWVGIHAAADTEYGWAWYGGLLGGNAWFEDHPTGTPTATLLVDAQNASHESTAHLGTDFEMQDEWYNYQANPSADVTVLLRLDEGSYNPNDGASGAMGDDHPIAWYHEYDGGRAWYTGLGHRSELYQDARFTQHLLGGLRWAAGLSN